MLCKCTEILPDESFIYLADKANMPYGNKSKQDIVRFATSCADRLFSLNCKAVVIACNTATATAVDTVRALYGTRIVVGLEPAIRPCIKELGKFGYAVALVTEATYRSEKFNRLLATGEKKIVPLAAPELAKQIEENITDIRRLYPVVCDLFKDRADAESVILGCSHYSYISPLIEKFYDGKIKIYDGAEGAARRLKYCLELAGLTSDGKMPPTIRFLSTYR